MIQFKYAVPLEQTMEFEAVYPEPLQLELSEKRELWEIPGSIFVWMYIYGRLAGESYGTPIAGSEDDIEGLSGIGEHEKKISFHCYSNTILPEYEGQGLGTVLKAHWLGLVRVKVFLPFMDTPAQERARP